MQYTLVPFPWKKKTEAIIGCIQDPNWVWSLLNCMWDMLNWHFRGSRFKLGIFSMEIGLITMKKKRLCCQLKSQHTKRRGLWLGNRNIWESCMQWIQLGELITIKEIGKVYLHIFVWLWLWGERRNEIKTADWYLIKNFFKKSGIFLFKFEVFEDGISNKSFRLLICTRDYAKYFACIITFNLHTNFMKYELKH